MDITVRVPDASEIKCGAEDAKALAHLARHILARCDQAMGLLARIDAPSGYGFDELGEAAEALLIELTIVAGD